MTTITRRRTAAVSVTAAAALALAACSSSTDTAAPSASPTPADSTTESVAAAPAALVGPACTEYAEAHPSGPASIAAMAEMPVTEAAAANPMLTTLTAAVSGGLNPDVDLTEVLDSGEFTVFAPVDEAFAAIDPDTLDTVVTDPDGLTEVLTYHVVPERLAPDEVVGSHTTVAGAELTVAGSGDALTAGGAAVLCGGVQTQGSTVYLLDAVLLPPTDEVS